TDFFFDTNKMERARDRISSDFPIIQHKKVLLYAPTYRDEELDTSAIALDLEKMYRALSQEYIIFLRLHPAVSSEFENEFPGFVFMFPIHRASIIYFLLLMYSLRTIRPFQ